MKRPVSDRARQLATAGSGRSRVLDSSDALGAVQESHWEIHRAYCEYQEVAEARRRLAVDVGETIRAFLDELVTAGWSEQAAPQRERPRTRWIGGIAAMIDPVNELIDEILARGPGRSERFELRPDRPRAGDPAFAEASALHQTEGAGSRLVNEARLRSSGSIDPCDAGRAS